MKAWKNLRAAASRAVSGSPRAPLLAQCGDQGGVPVFLVEHLALGDPRGDHDGRDPVARPVEPEPRAVAAVQNDRFMNVCEGTSQNQ